MQNSPGSTSHHGEPALAQWEIRIDAPRHVDLQDHINTAVAGLVQALNDAKMRCTIVAFDQDGEAFNDWAVCPRADTVNDTFTLAVDLRDNTFDGRADGADIDIYQRFAFTPDSNRA